MTYLDDEILKFSLSLEGKVPIPSSGDLKHLSLPK